MGGSSRDGGRREKENIQKAGEGQQQSKERMAKPQEQ